MQTCTVCLWSDGLGWSSIPLPALDWITISGFRSIKRIERLRLDPINVLIGANGSGKSNFINSFSFLHGIREGRLQKQVGEAGGANRLLHFGAKETGEILFHISFEAESNQYKIALETTADDSLIPTDEVTYFWDKKRFPQKPYSDPLARAGMEAGISQPQTASVASHVRRYLDSWRVYHFHDTGRSSPLKRSAPINDNRFLRPDGSNLPSFLYLLSKGHAGSFGLIKSVIKRVAPFFEDFVLSPSLLNPDVVRLEWKHVGSDDFFDASSLSDGTLRFIALATLFLQPEALRPSVILVDEPELGLHPYAVTMLASMVKAASKKTQIIISTQSSLLLDNFEPNDVLVADRVDGGTVMQRLKNEDLKDWLSKYSLGQLWEAGEFNGRPNLEV